jgi:succinoglycan biosynthesis transport protein ExoP
MNEHATTPDDEIDLAELFAGLASSWRMIASTALVSVALSYVYANHVVRPTYEAKSVFAFEQSGGGGALGNLGGAAALLGIGVGASKNDKLVFDRVAGRDFVMELSDDAGFYDDPYFNPRLGIGRLAQLKSYFGIAPKTDFSEPEVEQAIVSRFQKSVRIAATKNSSIEAIVTHRDPEAAADIANAVVRKILDDTLDDQVSKSMREVDYLGEQLSKVQSEMDVAVMELQEFSISRNALSLEDLVRRSTQLVKLRETRDATRRMYDGVAAMISASQAGDVRTDVLQSYPELLSSEFRIQSQMSSNELPISELPIDRLEQIALSLSVRLQDIDAAIASSESSAKISADEASELLALKREVSVQEATYQVLVEQYKARSVMSGFAEASGTILQFAVPPLEPSAPKSSLILALGAVLGVFVGAGIALARRVTSGRLHTARAIAEAVMAGKVFRMKRNALPSEAVANLVGTSKYLVMWHLSSSTNKSSETAAHQLLKAWLDAGLSVGILSLPSKGSMTTSPSASYIDIGDVMGHLLRGNLRDAIEAKTSQLDRVLVICDFGKVPSSVLSTMKSLPSTIVAVAMAGDVVKSSTEELRSSAVPDVLLLG